MLADDKTQVATMIALDDVFIIDVTTEWTKMVGAACCCAPTNVNRGERVVDLS